MFQSELKKKLSIVKLKTKSTMLELTPKKVTGNQMKEQTPLFQSEFEKRKLGIKTHHSEPKNY